MAFHKTNPVRPAATDITAGITPRIRTHSRVGALLLALLILSLSLSGCGAAEGAAVGQQFPEFTMLDLQGNAVTHDIFAERDLTVVNIWGTFCPPCIREMPDLGKLHRTLEADYNATLVGIVVDVQDRATLDLANEILGQSQAEHLNLLVGEDVYEFLSQYDYVPTTLFVDSNGRLVGDPVVGGFTHDEYLAEVKARLQ
jgi:thiol-disulfide isomerase/thioredoxin